MFKMSTFCHSTFQQRRLTERHTVSIVANGILLIACSTWSLSSSSVCGFVMNTRFLDTNLTRTLPQWLLWGSCKNLHDCISTRVISETSISSTPTFQHILHVPSTSNLSRILVTVTLVGGGLPNSTLQRRWTSTQFFIFQ